MKNYLHTQINRTFAVAAIKLQPVFFDRFIKKTKDLPKHLVRRVTEMYQDQNMKLFILKDVNQ